MKTTALIHLLMAISLYPACEGYVQPRLPSKLNKPAVALMLDWHQMSSSPPPLLAVASKDKHSGIDPTKAIKEAIETTKKYGATSYKARMAWEVVEKMEYSYQNRSKKVEKKKLNLAEDTKKTEMPCIDIVDDKFDIVSSVSGAGCADNVRDLKSLLDQEMAKVKELKDMANKIKSVKKSTTIHKTKSIEAIAAAQEATRAYGIHSAETSLAWEAFEEIVSKSQNSGLAP